jgi:quaternary ammonium compound-resistance protein SugE
MAWFLLIIAGFFEVGWAVFLKLSDGFKHVVPSIVFVVCTIASLALLSVSLKSLPVGTAYAVWTGIGAAGTAIVGMLFLNDPVGVVRILSIILIIGGVIGLNLSSSAAH